MNKAPNIPDDRSVLMLYLADELPMGLRHEIDARLSREPELATMFHDLQALDHQVRLLAELPLDESRGQALVSRAMIEIRRQAAMPAPPSDNIVENPIEIRRKRAVVVGYSAFAAAACIVLGLGLWTLGLFDPVPPTQVDGFVPSGAIVDLNDGFLNAHDALTPRLYEADEHLRALRENTHDDQWLMML